MKNILSGSLIFISLLSFSQIKEGAKVVDLSLSFSTTDGEDRIFIQPLIGFGTSENQVFYVGFAHNSQKRNFDFSGESKTNISSLLVGYEKFIELNDRVYFSPFFSASYGFGKIEDSGNETDLNNFSLSLRPRLHYFMNNKWSVVASVGALQFSRQTSENAFGDLTTNIFSGSLNASSVFFGIRLNLNNE